MPLTSPDGAENECGRDQRSRSDNQADGAGSPFLAKALYKVSLPTESATA